MTTPQLIKLKELLATYVDKELSSKDDYISKYYKAKAKRLLDEIN